MLLSCRIFLAKHWNLVTSQLDISYNY